MQFPKQMTGNAVAQQTQQQLVIDCSNTTVSDLTRTYTCSTGGGTDMQMQTNENC